MNILELTHVTKTYQFKKTASSYQSLREELTHLFSSKKTTNLMYALKNVSFNVRRGERLGIIGPNGAGKSTLLKLISRISSPDKGKIVISGSVLSLLEVGTGFHPELTGRENIYLNGSILGMTRAKINELFDEIVSFSEVGYYLDMPVKYYSSGMQVRLAFSVAAHLESDIMLVDEVLAVGDVRFQKKCLGKMNEIIKHGRTVIFVSHNMAAISDLCDRCIYLDKGEIKYIGPTKKAIASYLNADSLTKSRVLYGKRFPDNQKTNNFYFEKITLYNSDRKKTSTIAYKEPFLISIEGIFQRSCPDLIIGLTVMSATGAQLYNVQIDERQLKTAGFTGRVLLTLSVDPNIFAPGIYSVGLGALGKNITSWVPEAVSFHVTNMSGKNNEQSYPLYDGIVSYPRKWKVSKK